MMQLPLADRLPVCWRWYSKPKQMAIGTSGKPWRPLLRPGQRQCRHRAKKSTADPWPAVSALSASSSFSCAPVKYVFCTLFRNNNDCNRRSGKANCHLLQAGHSMANRTSRPAKLMARFLSSGATEKQQNVNESWTFRARAGKSEI